MYRFKILFTTLWISLLISAIIILIPFLFRGQDNINTTISIGASILSGFAGCATIIVAVLLYQNIHYTNAIQKQIDTINSFLENIKVLQIKIGIVHEGKEVIYASFAIQSKYRSNNYIHELGKKYDYPIAFGTDNYYEGLGELLKIANSIYMPVELQPHLRFLGPHVFQQVADNESKNFIKLVVNAKYNPINLEDQPWMIICGDQVMTLKEFIEKIQAIIEEMFNWLKKHSNTKIAFNI